MGSSGDDPDIDPGTEDEVSEIRLQMSGRRGGSGEEGEVHEEGNKENTNPERPTQTRVTETSERINKVQTDRLQGIDDLSSAINSLDDHTQAGLQEIRNCVANLSRERTELQKHVKSLSDEKRHVSAERDKYREAVALLQQEVTNLREQLSGQQQDNEEVMRRMQEMREREARHLQSIAGRSRKRRLAHDAFVTWRRKVLNKNHGNSIQMLVEENNQLRAELLLCQEAAKKAFLRSANVLNSEAITMFQDAATRRLGLEENSDQSHSSKSSSCSSQGSQCEKPGDQGVESANKENGGRYKDGRDGRRDEGQARSESKRPSGDFSHVYHSHGTLRQNGRSQPYSASHRGLEREHSDSHIPSPYHKTYGREDLDDSSPPSSSSESLSHYPSMHQTGASGHQGSFHYRPGASSHRLGTKYTDIRADQGAVPKRRPVISDFAPDSLRQETRAYLQQLRDERIVRSELPPASSFESQRATQRVSSAPKDAAKTKSCQCRPTSVKAAGTPTPYKCPYCTPIQNSSFGHAKDHPKANEHPRLTQGVSNLTRNTILTGMNADKKVIYTPSASTVIIEKHISK
ncbi:uncharacterized protein LOC121859026 [Homarus americanus]|uniref:Protein of centriole 5 n=1 Tax=Homarus americanus TaxID=6706 RepID=A0A8J5NEA0_HOMAM|nr:uncharacterized protein LOC121859026 [Homarus americanus]KAG7177889.1 hypothetical protein Hamer_G024988 [Homarus americanus]